MIKVDRPTGLIGYDTDSNVERRAAGLPTIFRIIRPRVVIYAVLIVLVSALMVFGLATRSTFEMNVLKDRAPSFVPLSDGRIQNNYTLKLVNKRIDAKAILLSVTGIDGIDVAIVGEGENDMNLSVAGEHVDRFRILIKAPADSLSGNDTLRIIATDTSTGEKDVNIVPFSSPKKK